jgi:hypothetical protein
MSFEHDIISNWEMFKSKAMALTTINTKAGIADLLEELESGENTIIMAPASTRIEYMGCYPGGLVEHSLRVLTVMAKLASVYSAPATLKASIMFTALFHDIGKVGYGQHPYFLEQKSEWHKNKLGQMYEISPEFVHIPTSQLSLFILTEHGIRLDINEWAAISSVRAEKDESIPYNNETLLSMMLKQAVKAASFEGKNRTSVTKIGNSK